MLHIEPGLLSKLVDEYVSYYKFKQVPSSLKHENRRFVLVEKQRILKDDMVPMVNEGINFANFRDKKWKCDIRFDPVCGTYTLFVVGDGKSAIARLRELAAIDDSYWSRQCDLLERGWMAFDKHRAYRRIPGVDYREADKGKRLGPRNRDEDGRRIITSW